MPSKAFLLLLLALYLIFEPLRVPLMMVLSALTARILIARGQSTIGTTQRQDTSPPD